jgi:hypothetical protein
MKGSVIVPLGKLSQGGGAHKSTSAGLSDDSAPPIPEMDSTAATEYDYRTRIEVLQ